MTRLLAKKSLGQNFLNSPDIARKIVDISGVSDKDTVVEIGPGEGMLTAFLLEKAEKVFVIEKDSRAIPILTERFAKEIADEKLKIIEADILDWTPSSCNLKNGGYAIVANIPYYITGEIMRKFLSEIAEKPKSMTLMLQKEVADRIIARDKKESLLSVSVKVYGTPKYGFTVKAGSFTPSPSIDSAVLHIADISNKFFKTESGAEISESKFFEILRAAFSHKRKRLIANIVGAIKIPKEKVEKAAIESGMSINERAEDVSIEQWKKLTEKISNI